MVNRSLTGPAARAGRGVEVVIGLDENAERAAARIAARTVQPVVVDVLVSGDALLEAAPACVPTIELRELESAMDSEGLSTTARAVLARIGA